MNRIKKVIFIAAGSLSLGVAVIGIFLPLVPTTPLLLLAAALYFRSSPKLYDWLLSRKRLGPYILQFRENKAIPLHAKIVSVSLLWLTIGYCIVCVAPYVWLKVLLGLIAAGVSWHILSYKTLK